MTLSLRGLEVHAPQVHALQVHAFDRDARARRLLAPLDLDLHPGRRLGVVGESGSGKSLTALSLLGLPPPGLRVQGALRYDDGSGEAREIALASREHAALRGRVLAWVPQDPLASLHPLRSVGAQLIETLRLHGARDAASARDEARRLLERVQLPDAVAALARFPHQFSGGQRQRIAIALALACKPRFVIADEPTSALDARIARDVLDLLDGLCREDGLGLMLISHDLPLVGAYADEVLVLRRGEVLERGPTREVFARPRHDYTRELIEADRLPAIGPEGPPTEAMSLPPAETLPGAVVGEPSGPATALAAQDAAAVGGSSGPSTALAARNAAAAGEPSGPSTALAAQDAAAVGGSSGPATALAARNAAAAGEPSGSATAFAARDAAAVGGPSGPTAEAAVLDRRSRSTALAFGPEDSPATARPLLRAEAIRMRYPRAPKPALDDVSIVLHRGEGLALLGESGSGKSTLGRAVLRLLRGAQGRVWLDGAELTALSGRDLRALRKRIGVVFQDPYASLDPRMRLGEIVSEPLRIHALGDRASRQRKAAELLVAVGLDPALAERYPHQASGGQRQRIAIARALACDPELLVCDEAVSALDAHHRRGVLELLARLKRERGLALLFVTHDLAAAAAVAERIAVLEAGKIVEYGETARVLGAPRHAHTQALVAARELR
jgi:peptide/nickel transport system ATP-binding protein